jgi:hypothetical protein
MRTIPVLLTVLAVAATTLVAGAAPASADIKHCGSEFTDYAGDGTMKTHTTICISNTGDGNTGDGITGGGTLTIRCYHQELGIFRSQDRCGATGTYEIRKGEWNGSVFKTGQFSGGGVDYPMIGEIYVCNPFSFARE